jgi:peptidyl-prolyl cis-trans isomerase SurA
VILLAVAPARAQQPGAGSPRDRILAVVGDNLLLESEWREQTAILSEQLGLAAGSTEQRRLAAESFDQMVEELVILAAAERDTLVRIDNEQVIQEADAEIDQIRERFPTEDEFLRQLRNSQWGSLAAYRSDIQDRKRRELMGQAFMEIHRDEIRPVTVSDEDVLQFWDDNQASFGNSPGIVRFEEIAVAVEPSAEAREASRSEAEQIRVELEDGRSFSAAARQYSDDPGSAENGGDLGWFGRGRMVGPFERVAFEAEPGDIVGPVETSYGYHLIQVLDRRGEEVRARHILFAFQLEANDHAEARERAEEIRGFVLAGADVDSLQAVVMVGDSGAAEVVELSETRLPQVYAGALENLGEDQATVIETPTGFSVLVGRGRTGGQAATFEEMEPRIRQQLAQQQAESAFIDRLREEVYVDVRVRPEEMLGG